MSEVHVIPITSGAYALVCESVRQEVGNRTTFIGVSPDIFDIEKSPDVISFQLYVRSYFPANDRPSSLSVSVCRNDIIVAVPVNGHVISQMDTSKLGEMSPGEVAVQTLDTIISVKELKFSAGDLLTILVALDDKSYVAAALQVMIRN